jgi:hypothetical protein
MEKSGKYRRTRLFMLTLGHSRKSVRLLVFRASNRVWAEPREMAFRRLGCVTRVVVLDNLREGVIVPNHSCAMAPNFTCVLLHPHQWLNGGIPLDCSLNRSNSVSCLVCLPI